MKIIKFIRPKQDISDVSKCDSCGATFKSNKTQYRSLDFARFLCEGCKSVVDTSLTSVGIDTKGYWKKFVPLVQTVPDVVKVYRPRRKRKCERTTAPKRF